jgi:hypothetical protein
MAGKKIGEEPLTVLILSTACFRENELEIARFLPISTGQSALSPIGKWPHFPYSSHPANM